MGARVQHLRKVVSRLQIILAMSIASLVVGAVIAAPMTGHLDFGPFFLRFALRLLVGQCWVWLVLPAVTYGTARAVELSRWTSVTTAALLGASVQLFLLFASYGGRGLFADWPSLLGQALLIGLGIFFAERASRRARSDSARAQAAAQKIAEARRAEYAEMMRASENLADRASGASGPSESQNKTG